MPIWPNDSSILSVAARPNRRFASLGVKSLLGVVSLIPNGMTLTDSPLTPKSHSISSFMRSIPTSPS